MIDFGEATIDKGEMKMAIKIKPYHLSFIIHHSLFPSKVL
jgi:hypothetical protein